MWASETDLRQHTFIRAIAAKSAVYQAETRIDYPHFIVVGDKSFRFETSHTQAKAVASFNNPYVGGSLKAVFEKLKSLPGVRKVEFPAA